ncbi:CPBP family intramembrane glutamic endopeptidase [Clostridium felsineum]|uniref:CPBP family intramembrane glutamic endopeptidase n=1 Tax=Clostridium felsineum TaxID=36839 RepID=UPI00098BE2B4|nr:type II CAAX endopeptidase family protein [Clostridium felsineum]URZ00527.1 hypothetical protein CLAUR_005150 [Clostridium felsineum]
MQYKVLNYIKKHEALSFIVMTYLFSWIMWGVVYASYTGVISKWIYNERSRLLLILGSFGPTTISIFFTGILYKKEGIKKLLLRLTKWKYNPVYYIFVIGWYPIMCYITVLIYNFMNNNSNMWFGGKPNLILISTISILIFGGSLGEEIGWRGYLLPRFQEKSSPLKSGLLIGIVWACWHIPLFLISGTSQYGIPFALFLILDIYISVLITWVFNRTNGSLIFPILIHTSYNVSLNLVHGLMPISFLFALIWIIFGLLTTIFIVSDMVKNKSRKAVNV